MLNWGIIGCGDVVQRKSGPAIQATGRSRIVGVMRRDADNARAYAEAHGVPLGTGDASAILNHPEVDIVYVATPPCAHEEYVVAAAHASKHVLVEKPMGLSADQAGRMIAACAEAGRELFVAYERRFDPHVQKMRELVVSGKIGTPLQGIVELGKAATPGDWRGIPAVSGGGYFADVGCHRLDLIARLFGVVESVHGVVTCRDGSRPAEYTVSLCAKFVSGAQLVATGDYVSGRRADRLRVIGTKGEVEIDSIDSFVVTLKTPSGEERFVFEKALHHLGLIQHIEAVLSGETENACSGRDALQTEIILDKGLRRFFPAG